MADLGFDSRAEMMNFVRQNLQLDPGSLGKGVVTQTNIRPGSIGIHTIATPGSIATADIQSNQIRESLMFLPVVRLFGAAKAIPTGVVTGYNAFTNPPSSNAFQDGSVYWNAGFPDRITVQRLGYYLVICSWVWAANAVGERQVQMFVGGAGTGFIDNRNPTPGGGAAGSLSFILPMNAATPVTVAVFQNSGGNLNITMEMHATFLSN